MQLKYFVYTSGELVDRENDWGVKYASPGFGERITLKKRYEALLKKYSLEASMREREDQKEYKGLFLLRENDVFYLGYVFPGHDHTDRVNTSSVVCEIPRDLVSGKRVNDIVSYIWSSNVLRQIASHLKDRPEMLDYNESSSISPDREYQFHRSVDWCESDAAYTQINGVLKKHVRTKGNIPVQKPKPGQPQRDPVDHGGEQGPTRSAPQFSTKILLGIAGSAIVAVVAAAALLMYGTGNAPTNDRTDVTLTSAGREQSTQNERRDEREQREGIGHNENVKIDINMIKERLIEYLDQRRPDISEKAHAFQTRIRQGNTFEQMRRAIEAIPGGREILTKVTKDEDGEHIRFSLGRDVSDDDLFLHKRQRDWYLDDCLDVFLRQFSSNSNSK